MISFLASYSSTSGSTYIPYDTLLYSFSVVFALNGKSPVSNMYIITPNDQISAAIGQYGYRLPISGAM